MASDDLVSMFCKLVGAEWFTGDKQALEQKAAGTSTATFKRRPCGSGRVDQVEMNYTPSLKVAPQGKGCCCVCSPLCKLSVVLSCSVGFVYLGKFRILNAYLFISHEVSAEVSLHVCLKAVGEDVALATTPSRALQKC